MITPLGLRDTVQERCEIALSRWLKQFRSNLPTVVAASSVGISLGAYKAGSASFSRFVI